MTSRAHTSPKNAQCSLCASYRADIRLAHFKNERLERAGKPPELDAIERAKRLIASCAARGHHNPHAGSDARWRTSP